MVQLAAAVRPPGPRSALIFTEALSHGCAPWRAAHQRRTLLYRFSSRGFDGGGASRGRVCHYKSPPNVLKDTYSHSCY